jgi:hypothetical protein
MRNKSVDSNNAVSSPRFLSCQHGFSYCRVVEIEVIIKSLGLSCIKYTEQKIINIGSIIYKGFIN